MARRARKITDPVVFSVHPVEPEPDTPPPEVRAVREVHESQRAAEAPLIGTSARGGPAEAASVGSASVATAADPARVAQSLTDVIDLAALEDDPRDLARAAAGGSAPPPVVALDPQSSSSGPAAESPGQEPPVTRRARLALATGSLAFVLGTVNVTVTNVAFADIIASFPGAAASLTGWILSGYALAFASTMLVGGRLADRYGRLLIFRIGLTGLLVSSLVAGLAPTIELLLLARAIQGVCGALTVPSSLSLVLGQFPASRQASVIGIWAAAGMVASGMAPGLAAVLLELATWRWIYLVLVPIAGFGLVGAARYMHETVERDLSRPLDLLGVGMGSAAVFLVVLGTLQGRTWGWGATPTLVCFVGGAALLPLFILRSSRHPEPLFDPRLFRVRSFAVANVAVALSMIGAFTSWFLWPYFLDGVWGYGKLGIGLGFTPSPIISGAVAVVGGRWADRHGFRGMMTLAAFSATCGSLWLWLFLDEDVEFWFAFFPSTVLFGLGMGILASQLNSAALRDIPQHSIATANGVHQSLRYAIGGTGVAVALAVLGGTQDVARYDQLWLLLGGLQFLVIPVMWFGYPRGSSKP
jgi:EmrB/QacA subfamily drug resistance transporter